MLTFTTPGQIPLDAFQKFGLNAKPMAKNPIGFFGTGLKYAVAICLRLGGTFRLFIGGTEYEFYTRHSEFRGKGFEDVRMRKRGPKGWLRSHSLPFTLELGKNWEPWMAVRELESNTRDEDGESMHWTETARDNTEFLRQHGIVNSDTSVIVIECEEMESAYLDGTIFLDDSREVLHSDIWCEVREGESDVIYMNGIRVMTLDKPSLYTYNLTKGIELTEDRTPKYTSLVRSYILDALIEADKRILDPVFDLSDEDSYFEQMLDWDDKQPHSGSYFYSALHARGPYSFRRMSSLYDSVTADSGDVRYLASLLGHQWVRVLEQLEHDNAYEALLASLIADGYTT